MKKLILIALAFAGLNVMATNPIAIKPIVNAPNCNGGSNGTISLVVNGGTAPYTYAWSGSLPATATQTGISAGNYTVTVTDNVGATAVYTVKVAQPFALNLSTSGQNASGSGSSDGCARVTVSGGTPDYLYNWSNGATVSNPCGLAAGTYIVTVTDAFGCTSTAAKTITQPSSPVHNTHHFNGFAQALGGSPFNNNGQQARSLSIDENNNNTSTEVTPLEVTLYPNPASNYFTIRAEGAQNSEITIVNTVGQLVKQIKTDAVETRIDVSDLAKGSYIVSVKTETEVQNKIVTIVK